VSLGFIFFVFIGLDTRQLDQKRSICFEYSMTVGISNALRSTALALLATNWR